jgi:6-phosphogluconate dehydrogenase (decarboxylating)
MANALTALQDYGESVWLDYIRRSLLTSGELKRLIEEDVYAFAEKVLSAMRHKFGGHVEPPAGD